MLRGHWSLSLGGPYQLGSTGLKSPRCQAERGSIKRWGKVPGQRASPCCMQCRSLLMKVCVLGSSLPLTLQALV